MLQRADAASCYNSLVPLPARHRGTAVDAQREAAEAYIVGQKHEGRTLVATQYSDGGYTGANMERPGVRQLLADIEAGLIDCELVYKVGPEVRLRGRF
jgi:DNA invertase Pin-like site-specific DNA recombinase